MQAPKVCPRKVQMFLGSGTLPDMWLRVCLQAQQGARLGCHVPEPTLLLLHQAKYVCAGAGTHHALLQVVSALCFDSAGI